MDDLRNTTRKFIELGINNTGNISATCVYIYFGRLRNYDVNTNKVTIKERLA